MSWRDRAVVLASIVLIVLSLVALGVSVAGAVNAIWPVCTSQRSAC